MNKVKLIKKGDIYFLDELKVDGYFTIGNSLVKPNGTMYNLSIKNCQSIERGYDLDELAKEYLFNNYQEKYTVKTNDEQFAVIEGFLSGFQKALELMKHKLSEETEWDVEIEMEKVPVKMPGVMVFTKAPKLDADGCLILKRI